jgi:leucyl aminopeptidase
MEVAATTQAALATGADTVVVGVFSDEGVAHDFGDGTLERLLDRGEARRSFRHLAVVHDGERRVILAGLGAPEHLGAEQARAVAAAVLDRATELGTQALCWELPHHVGDEIAGGLVEGTLLRAYRFTRYRPARDEDRLPKRLLLSAHHDVGPAVRSAEIVTRAQNRARDLANTAPNDLPPSALARYARATAERLPALAVRTLDEDAIRSAGMGAFAAVAQGSAQTAQLIEIRYEPPNAAGPLLGFIGKSVTFDSGGLSLKPPRTMFGMKIDMAGGAAVLEAIAAVAELELPVRILGVLGATENLPGGRAVKPGDIVRAMDGTTIEVNNTDAEGRLILADCLLHARAGGAERLVDVATLTGGVVTALGSVHAGLFSSDDTFAERVQAAAARSGELIWRLPLHPEYARMVHGRYAQLTNMAERSEAQAIVGAEFLHHFAGDLPWAHLDIAGMSDDVPRPYFAAKLATGFGVRLLVELAGAFAG